MTVGCQECGSLYDLIRNKTVPVDSELAVQLLKDISQGMRFLHESSPPICHADLKSSNVLVDRAMRAKVSDFGLTQKRVYLGQRVGTALWMSPELLNGGKPTLSSDVYAFAVIASEVLTRQDPYFGEVVKLVLAEVAQDKISPPRRPILPPDCPAELDFLVRRCWSSVANQRPAFAEVLRDLQAFERRLVSDGRLERSAGSDSLALELNRRFTACKLVNDVFPPHIAQALLQGKEVEPQKHDRVCVFFSDIVSYTVLCSQLEAHQVSNFLDRLYSKFDALCTKHGVTKIDTIGDAYLATTNLMRDQDEDFVARMSRFSLDAVRLAAGTAVDESDVGAGSLQIRVGFHCGSVVASVAGRSTKKFVLIGDAVNIASRMESTSLPGCVQCSKDAARLLASQDPTIPLVSRGIIKVKGKGDMETYWVGASPAPALSSPIERIPSAAAICSSAALHGGSTDQIATGCSPFNSAPGACGDGRPAVWTASSSALAPPTQPAIQGEAVWLVQGD